MTEIVVPWLWLEHRVEYRQRKTDATVCAANGAGQFQQKTELAAELHCLQMLGVVTGAVQHQAAWQISINSADAFAAADQAQSLQLADTGRGKRRVEQSAEGKLQKAALAIQRRRVAADLVKKTGARRQRRDQHRCCQQHCDQGFQGKQVFHRHCPERKSDSGQRPERIRNCR